MVGESLETTADGDPTTISGVIPADTTEEMKNMEEEEDIQCSNRSTSHQLIIIQDSSSSINLPGAGIRMEGGVEDLQASEEVDLLDGVEDEEEASITTNDIDAKTLFFSFSTLFFLSLFV